MKKRCVKLEAVIKKKRLEAVQRGLTGGTSSKPGREFLRRGAQWSCQSGCASSSGNRYAGFLEKDMWAMRSVAPLMLFASACLPEIVLGFGGSGLLSLGGRQQKGGISVRYPVRAGKVRFPTVLGPPVQGRAEGLDCDKQCLISSGALRTSASAIVDSGHPIWLWNRGMMTVGLVCVLRVRV